MNKNKIVLYFIFILCLVFSLLLNIYLFYKLQRQKSIQRSFENIPSTKTQLIKPSQTSKPSQIQPSDIIKEKISYQNPKFPYLNIIYNSDWKLETKEDINSSLPNLTNTLISITKKSTTLSFLINFSNNKESLICYSENERPIVKLSNDVARIQDSKNTFSYWKKPFYTEYNDSGITEMLELNPNYFECQKNNNCNYCITSPPYFGIIHSSIVDSSTSVTASTKPFYSGTLAISLIQTTKDEDTLKEADQIIINNLDSLK